MEPNDTARHSLAFVLPIIGLLIAYLTWLLFRQAHGPDAPPA